MKVAEYHCNVSETEARSRVTSFTHLFTALPGRLRPNGVVSALLKAAYVEELPRVNIYIASPPLFGMLVSPQAC
jgi:hypothetical protein